MGVLKAIWAALKAVRQIYKFARELDKRGVNRFSEAHGLEVRRRLEKWILRIEDGEDKGWRKLFKVDDAFAGWARTVLKSQRLTDADSGVGQTRAEARLKIYHCH